MDNANIHCNARIKVAVEQHGSQVRYLSSYSSDFNPIELSFSVLKAWVRRHFHELWSTFEGDFDAFLSYAVYRSRCDRFAMEHFKHTTYERLLFQGDIYELNARLAISEIDLN